MKNKPGFFPCAVTLYRLHVSVILVLVFLLILFVPETSASDTGTSAETSVTTSAEIASDNIDDSNERSEFILIPLPIYTPETKAALTLSALYHSRENESDNPSTYMAFLAYSQLNQFRIAGTSQSYLADGRFSVAGGVGFADWPDKFFGIGTDNTKDDEEDFTSRSVDVRLAVQYRIIKHLRAGVGTEFRNYEITDIEAGGLLDTAGVRGTQGGNVFGIGPVLTYDSRDNSFFPREGWLARLSATIFPENPGDYKFQRYRVDVRQYLPVGDTGVIAFQEYVNITRGDIPFQYLSEIGGSASPGRGYYSGLFRERDIAALQIEYRTHLWKKIGGAVFGSAGLIGPDLFAGKDLSLKPAGGVGLRYRIGREAINLRLDFAIGKGSSGVYFNILESF